MTHPFTTADADRLLGLGDQFMEDWKQAADLHRFGEVGPEYVERRAEWTSIRPMLVQAPAMRDLLDEARERWDLKLRYGVRIDHDELTEWMADWMRRVRAVTRSLPLSAPGPLRLPGLDGPG